MKKLITFIITAAMLLALASCTTPADEKVTVNSDGEYTVGICQLVQHPALDAATKGFIDTLKAKYGEKVTIIENNAQGDTTTCTTIVTNLVNKKVDLIMANSRSSGGRRRNEKDPDTRHLDHRVRRCSRNQELYGYCRKEHFRYCRSCSPRSAGEDGKGPFP